MPVEQLYVNIQNEYLSDWGTYISVTYAGNGTFSHIGYIGEYLVWNVSDEASIVGAFTINSEKHLCTPTSVVVAVSSTESSHIDMVVATVSLILPKKAVNVYPTNGVTTIAILTDNSGINPITVRGAYYVAKIDNSFNVSTDPFQSTRYLWWYVDVGNGLGLVNRTITYSNALTSDSSYTNTGADMALGIDGNWQFFATTSLGISSRFDYTWANSAKRYWRVDTGNYDGMTTGDVWSFTAVAISGFNPPTPLLSDHTLPDGSASGYNMFLAVKRLTACSNSSFWYETIGVT